MTASDHMLELFKIFLHTRGHPYMHDWPLVHRDDGFWRRRPVSQGAVGALSVVVFPPTFDDDLSLPQRVEELSVQQFVPEPGIKAFDVSILPWAPR